MEETHRVHKWKIENGKWKIAELACGELDYIRKPLNKSRPTG